MASELRLSQNLAEGLIELAQCLQAHGIRYALIGGIAAGYRSQPRFTVDLDLVLQIAQLKLPVVVDDLLARGFAADRTAVIRQWTHEHVTSFSYRGVRVDWLKPVLPCYQHVIDTATDEELLGVRVRMASAEALIFTKLVASRPQDLLDIQNLLAANRGRLGLDWVRQEWESVFAADDPRMQRFEAFVAEFYNDPSTSDQSTP